MVDFSQQVANFKNYGTYNYKFDDVGNEILNPSSSVFQQVYFALPLGTYVYNNSKILSFYDATFTEFVPVTSSVSSSASVFPQEAIDRINAITYQNEQLQGQLNSLVASSEMNSGSADNQSIKNTVIGLRIQLGQGTTTSDFQDVYPYLPVPLEMKNAPTSSV
jgi:hypothetical protein